MIEGLNVYASLKDITEPVDTVTLYVSANISSPLLADLMSMKPKRLIFNPGAENADLSRRAQAEGIQTLNACTLVMLKTGQF